jgi:16S rRNA (uracil1498-N3)-methyltransferase
MKEMAENMDDFIKLPRLYVDRELRVGQALALSAPQAHYLRNVLRRSAGDNIRLFNGRDGEWAAALEMPDKKLVAARPAKKLKEQPSDKTETHLLFAPLKKDALDVLIEKAVELGVTHLHPVLTQNTEARRLNEVRLRAQIIEAAEQCERLTLPVLAAPEDLSKKLAGWDQNTPLYACLERAGAEKLAGPFLPKAAFLIGPEGGFTAAEKQKIAALPYVISADLGAAILRAETAALFCLSARLLGG